MCVSEGLTPSLSTCCRNPPVGLEEDFTVSRLLPTRPCPAQYKLQSSYDEDGKALLVECPGRHHRWKMGRQYPVFKGSVFFLALRDPTRMHQLIDWHHSQGLEPDRVFFSIDSELLYYPYCADFGPLNLACLHSFCEMMRELLEHYGREGKKIVLYTSPDAQKRTNAACLLAAWLMFEHDHSPQEAWAPFDFDELPFEGYRDASYEPVTFSLTIPDVLAGLHRARACGLLDLASLDVQSYRQCDDPLIDLHVVVPDVFIAFRGPVEPEHPHAPSQLGATFQEPAAPHAYLRRFELLGVTDVVRLNSPRYNRAEFERAGMSFTHISYDDCSTPSSSVLAQFFEACRARQGVVAVHCKAGLGRTGTLIAAWLMRKHKFTGREAIAYLRVMRPGSVLGPQQEFLEQNEQLF